MNITMSKDRNMNFGKDNYMFKLEAERLVAFDSPDHLVPHGTANDNSKNRRFNDFVYKFVQSTIKLMDLGCSGGGMIEDFVNDGHLAVGLEGSDFSLKTKRACWATIPDNLFTCDVSKKYQVFYNDEPFKAHVITAWEVMEHFKTEDVPCVIEQIYKHLEDGGLFIGSISLSAVHNEIWHQCVQNREWWNAQFSKFTFRQDLVDELNKNEAWVRHPEYGVVFQK